MTTQFSFRPLRRPGGRRRWLDVCEQWRRAAQRIALIHEARWLSNRRWWRFFTLDLLASAQIARIGALTTAAWETALDHTNSFLPTPLSDLSDLDRFRDDETRAIPPFVDADESLAVLVNRILRDRRIPLPPGLSREDAARLVRAIDLGRVAEELALPRVAPLDLMLPIGADVFLREGIVGELTDRCFQEIKLPLAANEVSDRAVAWALRRFDFDRLDEFSGDIRHLRDLSFADDRRYLTAEWIAEVSDRLWRDVRLPLVPNDASDRAIRRVLARDDFVTRLLRGFASVRGEARPVDEFELRVPECAQWRSDDVLEGIFAAVRLPVVPNAVAQETVRKITAESPSGVFATVDVDPIRDFSRRVIYDLSDPVERLFADSSRPIVDRLPLISAEAFAADVAPDIVDIDLMPTIGHLPRKECVALRRYREIDASYHALVARRGILEGIYEELPTPIVPNEPSEKQVKEIAAGVDCFDHEPWDCVYIERLNLPRVPVEVHANLSTAAVVSTSLMKKLTLPVCANVPHRRVISGIAASRYAFSTPLDVSALLNFAVEEAEIYMNDGIAHDILFSIVAAFEDRIPIVPNRPTPAGIAALVAHLPLSPPSPSPYFQAFSGLHPHHRHIDFAMLESVTSRFVASSLSLPLSPNRCTPAAARAILACLDPLAFFDFALCDALPLLHLQAPDDLVILLDSTVDRLMALILAQDVMPEVPLGLDVDTSLAISALSPLIGDPLPSVVDLTVDLLQQLIPVDVPPFITPSDVIDWILYDRVLPFVPLAAADIDDLLLLDGGPSMDNDEDLADPDVQAMLSKYTKARSRASDRS